MIIDCHTHVFSDRVINDRDLYQKDAHFNLLYRSKKARMINHLNLVSEMKDNKIDYSVTMGFPWY